MTAPDPGLRARPVATACVLLAAALSGVLFAPVFSLPALLLPIGVLVAAMFLGTLVCTRVPALMPWRGLVVVLVGLLAITEVLLAPTTVAGLPTGETLRALALGVSESWQQTLQSTWPARPDPALLLFVPLLVLLAGVLGVELLHRLSAPLLALLPGFAVALLSQLFFALPPLPASAAALGYAALGCLLLVVSRPYRTTVHGSGERTGFARLALTASPAVLLGTLCAVLLATVLPASEPTFAVQRARGAPLSDAPLTNPLNEIADRLGNPDVPVFDVLRGNGADRWRLAVLDTFDGSNWTSRSAYRRMGTSLRPDPSVTLPVRERSARVSVRDTGGPWLPSQLAPSRVHGVDPLVAEDQGTLLAQRQASGPVGYTVSWWEPVFAGHSLDGAGIDPDAPGGLGGVGQVPPGIEALAERAVNGLRPSFATALLLERFLRENYRTATGTPLPTGHGWPQLREFLLDTKRGTSEQFAAAYVALARIRGIPARLAVGFRSPAKDDRLYTVRNADVLAWPEVAVQGAGWVALDPGGSQVAKGRQPASAVAAATEQARSRLPKSDEVRDPPVARPPPPEEVESESMLPVPLSALVAVPLGTLLCWVAGVPLAKAIRCRTRRRKVGAPAVLGAWDEVRDRLRAHGVPVTPGMTVRDLATAAERIVDQDTVDGMFDLCRTVDRVLWSGTEAGKWSGIVAWEAVQTVRNGLSRRSFRSRLRAALEPRSLLPPRR